LVRAPVLLIETALVMLNRAHSAVKHPKWIPRYAWNDKKGVFGMADTYSE